MTHKRRSPDDIKSSEERIKALRAEVISSGGVRNLAKKTGQSESALRNMLNGYVKIPDHLICIRYRGDDELPRRGNEIIRR